MNQFFFLLFPQVGLSGFKVLTERVDSVSPSTHLGVG